MELFARFMEKFDIRGRLKIHRRIILDQRRL